MTGKQQRLGKHLQHLEFAARKASEKDEYIAFSLHQYMLHERLSRDQLMTSLNCSAKDYYRLCLCRIPKVQAETFGSHVQRIAQFANASAVVLAKIVKRVSVIRALKTPSGSVSEHPFLLAARDREDENGDEDASPEER